jgi:hypothetical protein
MRDEGDEQMEEADLQPELIADYDMLEPEQEVAQAYVSLTVLKHACAAFPHKQRSFLHSSPNCSGCLGSA